MNFISNLISNPYLSNIDSDFYLSMGLCFLVVIIMNIVFWNFKPQKVNK